MPYLFEQFDVSRETMERLKAFGTLLEKWTQKINLISPDTVSILWNRHIIDSAQLYPLIPHETKHLADLGSGGGLPALVLAIIAKEKNAHMNVTLVESDVRKSTFLSTVNRELSLNATIENKRIADVDPLGADVLTARALAPLVDLAPMLLHHLSQTGKALLPKGKSHKSEIDVALRSWHMKVTEHPSLTETQACILEVKDISRANPQS